MVQLKKNKNMKRNPFYDTFETEEEIIGFARPRKGRNSKRDRYKSKSERELWH
jgi:hypothetical protein